MVSCLWPGQSKQKQKQNYIVYICMCMYLIPQLSSKKFHKANLIQIMHAETYILHIYVQIERYVHMYIYIHIPSVGCLCTNQKLRPLQTQEWNGKKLPKISISKPKAQAQSEVLPWAARNICMYVHVYVSICMYVCMQNLGGKKLGMTKAKRRSLSQHTKIIIYADFKAVIATVFRVCAAFFLFFFFLNLRYVSYLCGYVYVGRRTQLQSS